MAGSLLELWPQLVNQLVGAAQWQHFNQRRHVSKDWQRWIWGSRISNNQIFGERILSILNDQRTSKNAFSLTLQLTLTKGVSLKVQYPPNRCLQSQSLVTGKTLDTLKVSQDIVWAVCQHRNVFAADATIENARFASRIRSSSDEEPTDFICSPHLRHFICALWPHTTTGIAGFWFVCAGVTRVKNMWTRRCNTLSNCWRTASNSVNRKNTPKGGNLRKLWKTY